MNRIVVVGGGITGLAATHRLIRQTAHSPSPPEILLLEASARLGGTLRTTARDGFILEAGPDCFIEKLRVMELCRELALSDQLLATCDQNRRSFIVRGGKLHPVPEGFYLIAPSRLRPFLASPLLSWRGKWRVLLEACLPSRPQRDESLASFVRRRLGREGLDWLAQPLLGGIYAADPETLSLRSTFPQFLDMEEKYGSVLVGLKKRDTSVQEASGARYNLFFSLRGGMQSLVDQLEKQLNARSVRLNTAVQNVRRRTSGDGWQIHLVKGEPLQADAVCIALPAYRCAELLSEEAPALRALLNSVPYTSSATLNLAYRESDIPHPLDGFGFVTPAAEHRPTLACTFVHRKFTGRAPAGKALLRAFLGGALQTELLKLDDAELERRVREDLRDLLGISAAPLFSIVERWPNAMPQYTVGHFQRVLQLEEQLLGMKGLALAGNWLRGVGIPDCIESGERAADGLLAETAEGRSSVTRK